MPDQPDGRVRKCGANRLFRHAICPEESSRKNTTKKIPTKLAKRKNHTEICSGEVLKLHLKYDVRLVSGTAGSKTGEGRERYICAYR